MSEESAIFRAVADDTRRAILGLLSTARRPVGDLAASFPDISRPAVSKHLRILREAGLVTETRDGRRRLYRLRPQALDAIGRWLAEVETPRAATVPAARTAPAKRRGAPARATRPTRRRPGLRPLRRDEPEERDWRTW